MCHIMFADVHFMDSKEHVSVGLLSISVDRKNATNLCHSDFLVLVTCTILRVLSMHVLT